MNTYANEKCVPAADRIVALSDAINAMPLSDFYGCSKRYTWAEVEAEVAATGTYVKQPDIFALMDMTDVLSKQKYTAPTKDNCPNIGQHPRLLFTKENIPAIKAAMKDPRCAVVMENFRQDIACEMDGILPKLKYEEPVALRKSGQYQLSNFDDSVLTKIQSKAFYYAVTGEKLYGYQAVYCIFNYLRTLDIGYRGTDQCRYYGYTAYISALVYDWCYDLMTPDVREKLALAIQSTCYTGYSSLPEGHLGIGDKTEVGFPPIGGSGPVEGHGCEPELLRDLLSVSIAIYDEHPDWYHLIGGRIFAQYIPIRNFYYESGNIYPCGTGCYAQFRYHADERCAWLLTAALGKNPFSPAMKQVVRSFAAHTLTEKDGIFGTGDSGACTVRSFWTDMILSSFLFDDPYMRDYAQQLFAEGGGRGVESLTPAELLICAMKGTETKPYRDCLAPVTYNGGYYQQIIARKRWSDDSPIVLLRGASSTTFDHTHRAAGKFEIYYKGMLSGGDGIYYVYGADHHMYYNQSTIAHSCLLTFNPDLKDRDHGFYSGGQPRPRNIGPADEYQYFIDGAYSTGKVLGVKYGYDDAGDAKYVYYANDLTKGYEINVVDYVGRSVVATFPGGDYPMVLFICDRMDVPDTDYTKTFILQCAKEPVLDTVNKTAVVDNGTGGRMVLKNLYGGETIQSSGASREEDPNRYWISTQNKGLPSGGQGDDPFAWGKIEVIAPMGNTCDVMVNIVYVTDSTNSKMLDTELLTGTGYYGARAAGQTAIFAFGTDGTSYAEDAITFTAFGTGAQDYYVGGLTAGTWSVSVGNQNLGNMTVASGENVLVFSAEGTGTVTVAPVSLSK